MAGQKRRRSRLQISLRTMLIVVTLVGIALANDVRYRRQHLAADQLKQGNTQQIAESVHRLFGSQTIGWRFTGAFATA